MSYLCTEQSLIITTPIDGESHRVNEAICMLPLLWRAPQREEGSGLVTLIYPLTGEKVIFDLQEIVGPSVWHTVGYVGAYSRSVEATGHLWDIHVF